MTDLDLLYFGAFILVVAFFIWQAKKPDKDGRYPDSAVTVDLVENVLLEEFELKRSEKLKYGYTEKTIERQLESIFEQKFQHVVSQYGLDSLNGEKIDFDIGRGKVGLEIKLAKSVFKTSAQNGMIGQVQSYISSKYSSKNLLLVIFCEPEHIAQRVVVKNIRERLTDMDVKVLFLEM